MRLTLRSGPIAAAAQPGQFLHIACAQPEPYPTAAGEGPSTRADASLCLSATGPAGQPLLRRPLGVHAVHGPRYEPHRLRRGQSVEERGDTFDLLAKVVGAGTRALAQRRPGDLLDVIGPLGRPFEIRPDLECAVIVAGGAGIAPLFFLAQELRARGKATAAVIGATTEEAFPLPLRRAGSLPQVVPLEDMGVESVLVTESGQGLLVTDYLKAHLDDLLDGTSPAAVELFGCGPLGMLAELARIAGEDLPCQVLLEERMCCGLGACRGCVTRVRDPDSPQGYSFRTVCGDGPVFRAADVVWD